ncbi:MAG: endolytic transglycosylase MltG [Bacteroidota bacterium]|nr:endolytic transglycosylase MltG [Bacteroidota bacterium]
MKKRSLLPFKVVSILALALVIALFFAYKFAMKIYEPNVMLNDIQEDARLYIPSGSDYDDVLQLLNNQNFISDIKSFEWVAKKMNYPASVHPGSYLIKKGMNNYDFISKLRVGSTTPVYLTINCVRSLDELAEIVGSKLESDKEEFYKAMIDDSFFKANGLNKNTVLTFFIPNTYEFYWIASPEEFLSKMKKEYDKFWTAERKEKATKLNLSQIEVSILASIIQEETSKKDELGKIARVYLNRLKRGMLLQADPTLKFALKDRSIKRLLNEHKKVNSLYNTYKYKGLPPGPIVLPQISSMDGVLNAENHNYIYFCAKADMSGYHYFSTNYRQHLNYARRYHRKLNSLNIR